MAFSIRQALENPKIQAIQKRMEGLEFELKGIQVQKTLAQQMEQTGSQELGKEAQSIFRPIGGQG